MGMKEDETRAEYGFRKRKVVQTVEIGDNNINNTNGNVEKNSDDGDVVFLHETSGGSRGKYRHNLQLCESMTIEVTSGQMLTDMTINYASLLLHKQFPLIPGFEDTELGCKDLISPHSGKFVQILFSDSHWLLAAGAELVTSDENIRIFDSNNRNGDLSEGFIRQICSLRGSSDDEISVSIESVQQQSNGVDCGVLVLCFAVDLVHDLNPAERHYNLSKLRPHLHDCLIEGKFTPFPTFNRKTKRCEKYSFSIKPLELRTMLSNVDKDDSDVTLVPTVSKKKVLTSSPAAPDVVEDPTWTGTSVKKKGGQKKKRNVLPRSTIPDCQQCKYCKNMKKYGGPGTMKQKCALKWIK